MIKHINKNGNIYINIFLYLLFIIFLSCYFYITGEIYYCDDEVTYYNNTSSWENNYRNRTNGSTSYSTRYSDGRPLYQPYREELQPRAYEYPTHYSDGRPLYQPYNEGLQYTSNGHRYELPINDSVRFANNLGVNKEPFVVELDGNTVYAKHMSTDIHGNHLYSYSYDGSTQIGVIEPTMSEVNRYYTGGPK
jgi:hypothetical protein